MRRLGLRVPPEQQVVRHHVPPIGRSRAGRIALIGRPAIVVACSSGCAARTPSGHESICISKPESNRPATVPPVRPVTDQRARAPFIVVNHAPRLGPCAQRGRAARRRAANTEDGAGRRLLDSLEEVLRLAFEKIAGERSTLRDLQAGDSLGTVFARYGIL